MKTKFKIKLLSIFLLATLLIPQFIQSTWTINVLAITMPATVATDYFFNQLDSANEIIFYRAMETMLEKGYFKRGNVSIEISGLDLSADNQTLLQQMGAARDAFMLDYPELFYVDFDALSIRIETDSANSRHVYLGTGRGNNYLNQDFRNDDGTANVDAIDRAIESLSNQLNSIADTARSKSTIYDKVLSAHDAVLNATTYKLDYAAQHPASVRTVYGVLGYHEAVCEGYARALKAVLDRLGIPAVLVHGAYLDDQGQPQEHMWLHVQQEDGRWYGVDPTFDDTNDNITHKYLLVDATTMSRHYPNGTISTSHKEFTFPGLESGDSSETNLTTSLTPNSIAYEGNGIKVEYLGNHAINDRGSSKTFRISYDNNNDGQYDNYADSANKGKYIIINSWQLVNNHATGNQDKPQTGWVYPIQNDSELYQDTDAGVLVPMANCYAFQVGITEVPPANPSDITAFYTGKESQITALSDPISTGNSATEYAAPFIAKSSPAITVKQVVGRTYHVSITYDQDLRYTDDNPNHEIGTIVTVYDYAYGYRPADADTMQFSIKNLQLVDKRTITYDFTPSKLWSLDNSAYLVQFTGIIGAISEKAPNTVSYVVANNPIACIYQLRDLDIDLEAYGKPTLMDDFDLADIIDSDTSTAENKSTITLPDETLQQYGDLLKHRLSLIATIPGADQDAELQDTLAEKLKGDRLLDDAENKTHVQTYNIELNLCTNQLKALKDGTKVRIKLGFPLGYTYSDTDNGVTFKAYHYIYDEENHKYDIEEINCIITELGLILEVRSFSPFAIAAVQKKADDPEYTVLRLESTSGGKIVDSEGKQVANAQNIATSDTTERTYSAVADDGYKISSITIDGEPIDIITDQPADLTPASDTTSTHSASPITTTTFTVAPGSTAITAFISTDTGIVIDPETGEEVDTDNSGNTSGNHGNNNQPSTDNPSNPDNSNNSTIPNAPNTGIANFLSAIAHGGLYIALTIASLLGITFIIRKESRDE